MSTGYSKSGYGDIFAGSRDKSGVFTTTANKLRDFTTQAVGNDWLTTLLSSADQERLRRQEEEREERRRQARRQEYINKRIAEEEKANKVSFRGGILENTPLGSYIGQQYRSQYEDFYGREYDAKEEARKWLLSPRAFLNTATAKKYNPKDDPFEWMAKDPDVATYVEGLFLGPNPRTGYQWSMEDTRRGLTEILGMPASVVEPFVAYLSSKRGSKKFRMMGTRDYGGPVEEFLTDVIGNRTVAQVGAGLLDATPLGAVERGLRPGPESGPGLASDALSAAGGRIVMGRGLNVIEDAVASRAGALAANPVASLAIRSATRAGLNVAEDTPLTAAEMALHGINPLSPEGRKILQTQAAVSAASGAALPVVGAGLRNVRRFPLAPELAAAGAGYVGAKAFGADDEDAAIVAGTAGLGVGLRRGTLQRYVPQLAEAVARGAERLGLVPEGGVPGAAMVFRKGRIPASATDLPEGVPPSTQRRVIPTQYSKPKPMDPGDEALIAELRGASNQRRTEILEHLASKYGNSLADGIGQPLPLANERLWFHSTGDLTFDLPDPSMGVKGISQLPGAYLAADPMKSYGHYGTRTFIVEFDGKALNLLDEADIQFWQGIKAEIDARLVKAGVDPSRIIYDPIAEAPRESLKRAELWTPTSNYAYRDAMWKYAEEGAKLENGTLELGEFERVRQTPFGRKSENIGGGLLSDVLRVSGVDALYHYSPRHEGDVLVVLNGNAARVVAEARDAGDALKAGATLAEIIVNGRGRIAHFAEPGWSWDVHPDTGVQYPVYTGRNAFVEVYPLKDGSGWEAYVSPIVDRRPQRINLRLSRSFPDEASARAYAEQIGGPPSSLPKRISPVTPAGRAPEYRQPRPRQFSAEGVGTDVTRAMEPYGARLPSLLPEAGVARGMGQEDAARLAATAALVTGVDTGSAQRAAGGLARLGAWLGITPDDGIPWAGALRNSPEIRSSDPYEILGLDPTRAYTAAELKAAYFKRAQEYHPDVNVSPTATIDMQKINAAYARLASKGGVGAEPPRPFGSSPPRLPPSPPSLPPPPPGRPTSPLDGGNIPPTNRAAVQAVRDKMDDALASGRVQVDTPRIMSQPLRGKYNPLQWVDPAVNLARGGFKVGHAAWTAAENYFREQVLVDTVLQMRDVRKLLDPLIGDAGFHLRVGPLIDISGQDLARAGVELAPLGAATAFSMADGEFGGRTDKMALAGAALAMAGISHSYALGRNRRYRFQAAKFIGNPKNRPEIISREPFYQLVDMIETTTRDPKTGKAVNIEYDISRLSPEARESLLLLNEQLRMKWIEDVNLHREAADLAPVQPRLKNLMYHMWTKKSGEKALGEKIELGQYREPGIGKEKGPALQRKLPDTLREALRKYPGLELAGRGDPRRLLQEQAIAFARMKADAVFVRGINESGESRAILTELKAAKDKARALGDLPRTDPRRKAAWQQVHSLWKERNSLRKQGWSEIPGFSEGHLYSPDVQKFIKRIFVDGSEPQGLMPRLLDAATTEIRQAAFVSDFSAWTMQGLMSMLASPATAISNAYHLLGASLFGRRYLEWMVSRNADEWRQFARSGGISGYEHEGQEKNIRTLGDFPGIRHVESAGFQAFLPMQRFLEWKNERNINSFLQKTGIFKNVGGSHLTVGVLNAAKYGGVLGAGYVIMQNEDMEGWEKALALAATGYLGSLGAKHIESVLGKKFYNSLSRADQIRVDVRSAKFANRTSGVLNRQQLGITPKQAMYERMLMARSPAILRNTLNLVRIALTNPGPEGAQAFFYLAKTGLLLGTAAYGIKYFTGEEDSLDPEDPKSILNPKSFARMDFGPAGKIGFSNPYLSLFRAVLQTPDVEGDNPASLENWNWRHAVSSFKENMLGRGPDVMTPLFYRDFFKSDEPGISTRLTERFKEGDVLGLVGATAGQFVPLAMRGFKETGQLEDVTGGLLQGDPNFNTGRERLLGTVIPITGANYSPETRSQEANRRTAEAISRQFPGITDRSGNRAIDRFDLNQERRELFDESAEGKELKAFREETRALRGGKDTVSQIDLYIERKAAALDGHIARLQELEAAVASGALSKSRWRKAYADEQARYRTEKQTIDKDFANQKVTNEDGTPRLVRDPKTGKAREFNVVEYLRRGDHPEDEAVDGYFALYDNPSLRKPDGTLDWEKLERAQQEYISSLDPLTAAYVQRRLDKFANLGIRNSAGEDVPLKTLQEYESIKDIAAPYWELRDSEFEKLRQADPFFAQFESYNDFRDQVAATARELGVQDSDILGQISSRHRSYRRFERNVERAQKKMRVANPYLDYGLQDFYDRPALNWRGAIARAMGVDDTPYRLSSVPRRPPSRRRQLSFARRLARQHGVSDEELTRLLNRVFVP